MILFFMGIVIVVGQMVVGALTEDTVRQIVIGMSKHSMSESFQGGTEKNSIVKIVELGVCHTGDTKFTKTRQLVNVQLNKFRSVYMPMILAKMHDVFIQLCVMILAPFLPPILHACILAVEPLGVSLPEATIGVIINQQIITFIRRRLNESRDVDLRRWRSFNLELIR